MKRKLLISLLVGMMGVIIIGCGDDMYVYTPNDNLYKYCAFDSSSYWIYEDSATHQIDSVVAQKLEKYEYHTNYNKDYNTGNFFSFKQTYKIINSDTIISQQILPYVSFAKPDDSGTGLNAEELYVIAPSYCEDVYTLSRLNLYYMNISIPSADWYAFDDDWQVFNDAFPKGFGNFKYSEHLDNITINNHTYHDIKKIEYRNTTYTNDPLYRIVICYWANGIGMVRRECHSSDSIVNVKNLIRYNVINVRNQYR